MVCASALSFLGGKSHPLLSLLSSLFKPDGNFFQYHFVTPLTSMVVTRPEDKLNKTKASQEAAFLSDDDMKPSE